ncbi:MAG: hypothetical protein Q7R87_03240 [Nanoarchaeota archaeon]|nr:hypothetical protein [Nanoarchaeota archaeon]
MRQIGKVEDPDNGRKRNVMYMALFMLLTLVLSTVGFAFYYNDSSNSNSNSAPVVEGESAPLTVQQQGNRWAVPFRGQYLYFAYPPNVTSNVEIDIQKDVSDYYGQKLFIDYKKEYIYSEIKDTLGSYVLETSKACYGSCLENIPEKTCEDNIIVFNETKFERVYQKDNCIFVDGDLRTVDLALYRILGITP